MTVLAPAKLTLSLRVTGVRPDGFHELDAEMVSLDLSDELTSTTATGSSTRPSGGRSDACPSQPVDRALAGAAAAPRCAW